MAQYVFLLALILFVGYLVIRLALVYLKRPYFENYWQAQLAAEMQPNAIRLIVFGDSISRGVGAGSPKNSLVGRSMRYIAEQTGRPVHVANYSRSGATANEVIDVQIPKADLQAADIIMLEIGANDTRKRTPEQYRSDLRRIIDALPLEKVVIADIPGLGNRNAYQATIDELLEGEEVARADFGRVFEDLRSALGITAGDFFHPNARGYNLWFQAFRPGIDEVLAKNNLRRN